MNIENFVLDWENMRVSNLVVTQNRIRNKWLIMQFVASGCKGDIHETIDINVGTDGVLTIWNGHHRLCAILMSHPNMKLKELVDLAEGNRYNVRFTFYTYDQFNEVNGIWKTPLDPKIHCRGSNNFAWKLIARNLSAHDIFNTYGSVAGGREDREIYTLQQLVNVEFPGAI